MYFAVDQWLPFQIPNQNRNEVTSLPLVNTMLLNCLRLSSKAEFRHSGESQNPGPFLYSAVGQWLPFQIPNQDRNDVTSLPPVNTMLLNCWGHRQKPSFVILAKARIQEPSYTLRLASGYPSKFRTKTGMTLHRCHSSIQCC